MTLFLTILIIILAVLLVAFIGLIIYVATQTTHPKKTSMEDAWKLEMSKDFVKKLDMNPASVYTITTDEGYVLHASFLPAYDYMDDYGRIENYDYKIVDGKKLIARVSDQGFFGRKILVQIENPSDEVCVTAIVAALIACKDSRDQANNMNMI